MDLEEAAAAFLGGTRHNGRAHTHEGMRRYVKPIRLESEILYEAAEHYERIGNDYMMRQCGYFAWRAIGAGR